MPAMSFIGGGAINFQQWFNFLGLVKDKRYSLCFVLPAATCSCACRDTALTFSPYSLTLAPLTTSLSWPARSFPPIGSPFQVCAPVNPLQPAAAVLLPCASVSEIWGIGKTHTVIHMCTSNVGPCLPPCSFWPASCFSCKRLCSLCAHCSSTSPLPTPPLPPLPLRWSP